MRSPRTDVSPARSRSRQHWMGVVASSTMVGLETAWMGLRKEKLPIGLSRFKILSVGRRDADGIGTSTTMLSARKPPEPELSDAITPPLPDGARRVQSLQPCRLSRPGQAARAGRPSRPAGDARRLPRHHRDGLGGETPARA